MKKFSLIILVLLWAILIIGCKGSDGHNKGDVKLLDTIRSTYRDSEYANSRYFSFDKQNRLTGITVEFDEYGVMSSQQIEYLNDGSIKVYDNETFYSANFDKKGNTITVYENEDPLPVEVLTINKDGFITKREKSGEGDGAWNSVITYEYKDGNPVKITTTITTQPANTTRVTTETMTYDDKKSPFFLPTLFINEILYTFLLD